MLKTPTTLNIPHAHRAKLAFAARLRLFLIRRRSRKLYGVTGRRFWNHYPLYLDLLERIDQECLTPDQVSSMKLGEATRSADYERRAASRFDASILEADDLDLIDSQAHLAKMADPIIMGDESIRSICNIGARVDLVSDFLARRHPDRHFFSVDFQESLARINGILNPPQNISFVSGYALSLLQKAEVSADLVLMNSTACLFLPRELAGYLNAMKRCEQYVILNEAWGPKASGMLWFAPPRPETIDPFKPDISEPHNVFLHNYPFHFERAGFELIESEIFMHRGDIRYRAIARRKDHPK